MDDEILVNKLAEGDKSAFEGLVKSYSYKIINTCYKFFPNIEDAEDISQEVFIQIFKSIKSFRKDSKLSTWIYRVTVTKCLDEIKRRNRKRRLVEFGKFLHLDIITDKLGGGKMPDKDIGYNESLDEVMRAMDSLPDNQRAAYTLSKVNSYTNREIAEILNTSISAVETLISRAGKKVRQELRDIINKQ